MEFLVDTDILVKHLMHAGEPSVTSLEIAMTKGICFTTAINASELLHGASGSDQLESVRKVIFALKVLGINSRYSLSVPDFTGLVGSSRDALFCSVAKSNKIPILTDDEGRYARSGIQVITSQELSN